MCNIKVRFFYKTMLIYSILFLLLSNAVTLRRDKSILFNRITIKILIYSALLSLINNYVVFLHKGIGLFGGLFYVTNTSQFFHLFIFFISGAILQLTAFYPRKLVYSEYLGVFSLLFSKLQFLKKLTISNIILKNGEQYSILEYTLVLLFVIIGSILYFYY